MSNVHLIFENLLRPFTPAARCCEDCNGTGVDAGSLGSHDRPDCPACDGSGHEVQYEPGDRLCFMDQDTGEHHMCTVVERRNCWYEVEVDGITDDLPSIHSSLIRGRAMGGK